MARLTQSEIKIESEVLSGKYTAVPKAQWGRYRAAARETVKKLSRINIRMKADDLEGIKRIADRKGMPYQTLIGSVLHQFATGAMVALDDAEQVERFREKIAV